MMNPTAHQGLHLWTVTRSDVFLSARRRRPISNNAAVFTPPIDLQALWLLWMLCPPKIRLIPPAPLVKCCMHLKAFEYIFGNIQNSCIVLTSMHSGHP